MLALKGTEEEEKEKEEEEEEEKEKEEEEEEKEEEKKETLTCLARESTYIQMCRGQSGRSVTIH
jgi:hypothetical protein